jgi:hypothetical protein
MTGLPLPVPFTKRETQLLKLTADRPFADPDKPPGAS